ncbi:MAG TPA: prepilin peptidase [Rhizomicrobium sp.]|jgi:prepilin peptidase CpaA|nr:prepilin peptidase [Rhizomicrobium sp.]HWA70019.1 prepilin peptidase [Rhizomicrobium sp.]
MLAEILVIALVPAILAAAGVWDIASFTIPNFLSLALIALFAVFAVAAGLTLPAVGLHLLAGFAGLAIGFGMFAAGWIGGGDAKLFAAMALWLGFADLLSYTLLASVFGGFLTLGLLVARQWPLPAPLVRQAWLLRLHDSRSGIPYGVALAAGAFFILPHTEIFRLAAGT